MPKTLLAVDDSATMRKVLEITFSGEDFRVITAEGRESALAKLSEDPSVVVVDTSLDGDDGYALAKEIRQRSPRATVLLLSSRYNPYDATRGRDAGADDYMDKPFDTQQLIDKVRKAMAAREAAAAQAAAPKPAPAAPPAAQPVSTATAPSLTSPVMHRPAPAAAPVAPPAIAVKPVVPTLTSRTHTLSFEGSPPPAAAAAPVVPPPVVGGGPLGARPAAPAGQAGGLSPVAPTHVSPAPPAVAPAHSAAAAAPAPAVAPAGGGANVGRVAQVSTSVNGHLSGKLSELGLTPAQADAVLALSREVVERVVWEVVPQLAEAIIKEEIARLTRE